MYSFQSESLGEGGILSTQCLCIMMNRFFRLLIASISGIGLLGLNSGLYGQASLPTSFDFNSPTAPMGWTMFQQNGNTTYSSGSDGNPSGRLDETNDHVEIFFAEEPGELSYHLRGSTFQGAPWDGTFSIQESVDGITWTDMRVLTNTSGVTVSGFTQYSDYPASATRYVRFFYTNKVSGSNMALDEVNLAIPGPTPPQEINITYNNAKVISGDNVAFNAPVNDSTDVTFTIANFGTVNTLLLSNMTITGPQSSEFQFLSAPIDSIVALDSVDLDLRFKPTVAGTRSAVLTISNNDADENPFVINLFGVGGNLASQPVNPPTNFTATDVRTFMMDLSFTPPSPAPDGGYLVLRRTGSPVASYPTDGVTYVRGDQIGASKVVYSGPATSFSPNNIIAAHDYHFAVFAYNGANQFTNYLEQAPLNGWVTSASLSLRDPTYYDQISTDSASFISDLTNLIQPHFQVFYANYLSTMIPFSSRDTTGFDKVITCAYSGEQKVYTEPFGFNQSNFSREHIFSSSWMPDSANSDSPPYSDQHNLLPTNLTQVNIPRSNHPFGEVVNVQSQYLDGKLGTDANGDLVYEPRESVKGDVARSIFYMTTAYNGWAGQAWDWNSLVGSRVQEQDQQLLKDWHFQDPPDAWEIARNDFLDTLQMNRNPFVDHPEYVCFIDFETLTKIADTLGPCAPVWIDPVEPDRVEMHIFPNPNRGDFVLRFTSDQEQLVAIRLVDVVGKEVYQEDFETQTGLNEHRVYTQNIPAGVYVLEMVLGEKVYAKKTVIGQ